MDDCYIATAPLLRTVQAFLQTQIAPQSQALDTDPEALLEAFQSLGQQGWLGMRVPVALGGRGADPPTYFSYQALVARYSGALAFLQTQHQSAASFIAGGSNPDLRRTYLPAMATGQRRLGVGFSHLRRPQSPLQARAVAGGYRLVGEIPWVTGYGLCPECVVGASLPGGEAVFGLLPLSRSEGPIHIGKPLSLVALGVTQTVQIALDDWLLPTPQVIDIKPPGWLPQRDRQGVLQAASLALGCAQAGLDAIAQTASQRPSEAWRPDWERLQRAVHDCFADCLARLQTPGHTPADLEQRQQLRARAVVLAGACAQGAIALAGGAANMPNHPAQRIYREALVFTVTGQTPELSQAILAQLSRL